MKPFHSQRMNIILYCRKWKETVAFYRDILKFPIKISNEWLIEFQTGRGACLSIADEKRTSIASSGGDGITVTFKVDNLNKLWQSLRRKQVAVDPIRNCRMGGQAFFLHDPEGHRMEFWSEQSKVWPEAEE